MREAKKLRIIEHLPIIEPSTKNTKHRDIFTEAEIKKLFPADDVDLHQVWALNKKDKSGYMFGLLHQVQLHAGMRPGEIRALQPQQVFAEYNTIYITHQLDSTDRIAPLKKSTSDDKKLRFVRIPAATMNRLIRWIESGDIEDGQLVFTFDGKLVRKDCLQSRFKKVKFFTMSIFLVVLMLEI